MREQELDLEDRRLCADGACIGVIGDDGRCRVCGSGVCGSGGEVTGGAIGAAPVATEAMPHEDSDDDRELCPDGACIGLIGQDGRCKVCGRERW